ncbi:MAG: hydrogenase maturation nickel metallochaperone HypA [Kiritimatiellaceae bacterium]|nr:hydrogenase maturation nickel metallochaperone HypA [Kiritimatiellaceae bacterium]
MIPMSLFQLFTLPLFIVLTALFSLACAYDLVIGRRQGTYRKKAICRCHNCRYIYAAPRRTPLARCPRCEKLNTPVRQ